MIGKTPKLSICNKTVYLGWDASPSQVKSKNSVIYDIAPAMPVD